MPAPSIPPFPSVLWTGSFRRSSRRRTYTIGRGCSRNQAVKRGMYHSGMPASDRYSAAAHQLVAELRARGYGAGCRAVEQWAAWGLAPAPERASLGRHGFTSRYPDGAIDQYAAVASVMRRGQDWRAAGLMLIGRAHLVAREKTFRLLLDYLFTPDTGISDPLEYADEQLAAATGQPLFKRIARIAQRNISAAKLTDPVTGRKIDAETAAISVMARGVATMLGETMPRDAAMETAAAWGMITADLPADVREHRIDVVNALTEHVLTFEQLAATARTVDPIRLQAVVREFRQSALEQPEQVLKLLPPIWADTLIITVAVATIAIEDLGGAAWLEDISPGLAQAEAQHQAPLRN
jgi:hypothetical protein